jgi:SAM-dependent methyltransferase
MKTDTTRSREKELLGHYDRNPRYYSPLHKHGFFFDMCSALGFEPDMTRVLDLGCGDGRMVGRLGVECERYVGVDYSSVRIDAARSIWRFVPGGASCDFLCDDVYDYLASTKERFTLAVAVEVLEHLEDPRTVLDRALSVADAVVGTVPVNMPYVAHLQVYRDERDVMNALQPTKLVVLGSHFACLWLSSGAS